MLRSRALPLAAIGAALGAAYPSGTFTWMHDGSTSSSLAMSAVDVLYFYPVTITDARGASSIFAGVATGGAGSSLKNALWRRDAVTGKPTGLPILGQNVGLDTSSSGVKAQAITTVIPPPGQYWGASKVTGTQPTMICASSADANPRVSFTTAVGTAGFMPTGFSTPDAFANDIMAFNATAAVWTNINNSRTPILGLGWA